jgi:hypothetical protein
MGIHDDYLQDDTFIERHEITEDDYKKYCVRCTKELWVDFTKNLVKPCKFSAGVDIKDYDGFFQYVKDINNDVKRDECNYCHIKDPEFRLLGNKLWLTPGQGNSHTEIVIDDNFDNDLLIKYVNYIAEDYYKFACICIVNNEPGKNIIEQNHIELIAKPFFAANKLKNRRLRYDFFTKLDFSIERTKKIIRYMKKMQRRYPTLDINIQPTEYSLTTNNFLEKIDLFITADFEILLELKI